MKISCIEPLGISQQQFETLKNDYAQRGHEFVYYLDRKEDEATLCQRMAGADVVVVSNIPLSAATLSQCPQLKYLSVAFTGLDHIDLAYCSEHGIEVQNAAGYSTTAVSELAVGLMLDLLRRISMFNNSIRNGEGRGAFLGSELRGKTVGVVGTGAIGTATIRLLLAFGCNVVAYNKSRHADVEAMGVQYLPLDELLRVSDIVTLHVPLTEATRGMIGSKQLTMMKPSAILINTARGAVMDLSAVAAALTSASIAGVATDVYEQEPPLPLDHQLLHAPNCICLPHVGFATHESFATRAEIVFSHVNEWLSLQ